MEKEIKIVPEFNEEMEIVAIEVSCNNEGVLNMLDRDRLNELLNAQLGEEYNIQVEVTETQLRKLQDDGTVKITLETETSIKEKNSVVMDQNDVDMEGQDVIIETKPTFRKSSSYSIYNKVNRLAGEILADYLEKDFVITEAIIRRGMAVYKTYFEINKSNMKVYTTSGPISSIEINLLDKIADSVEIFSTGMDSRNVVSKIEQEKEGKIFLQLEVEFPDGNIIGKYKLEKRKDFAKRAIDISF